MKKHDFTLAAKCAPCENLLNIISETGIKAVELYLSGKILADVDGILKLCSGYDMEYALHGPNDAFEPEKLLRLFDGLNARALVMHDVLWEDEWMRMIDMFGGRLNRVCVENLGCVHDPAKFMRRYGMGRCLDLEHLQMEAGGVYDEEFIAVMHDAGHIHLTGYYSGSRLWHTPVHFSPEHSGKLMDMLVKAGYGGLVVSEASVIYQNRAEFAKLKDFYDGWANGN